MKPCKEWLKLYRTAGRLWKKYEEMVAEGFCVVHGRNPKDHDGFAALFDHEKKLNAAYLDFDKTTRAFIKHKCEICK